MTERAFTYPMLVDWLTSGNISQDSARIVGELYSEKPPYNSNTVDYVKYKVQELQTRWRQQEQAGSSRAPLAAPKPPNTTTFESNPAVTTTPLSSLLEQESALLTFQQITALTEQEVSCWIQDPILPYGLPGFTTLLDLSSGWNGSIAELVEATLSLLSNQ